MLLSATLFILCGSVGSVGSVTMTDDKMLVIDGKRSFLLGLYETPKDDAVLKEVVQAGFNLVFTGDNPAAFDRVEKAGLHAWINVGPSIDFSEDKAAREEKLRQLVASYASRRALLAWEVPDEALWNCWCDSVDWRGDIERSQQKAKIDGLTDKALAGKLRIKREEANRLFAQGEFARSERLADDIWRDLGAPSPNKGLDVSKAPDRAAKMAAGLREGYAFLKQLDPRHPIWMNHAPRNQLKDLTAFGKAADAVGCDIYPVPEFQSGHSDLPNRSLSSVGAYTDRMQRSAPGKPVWMVLQGFGWSDLDAKPTEESRKLRPRPTFAESRFMAYDAIAHGARGILYWGTASIEKDSTLWKDLLKLARELADLEPALSAPDASLDAKVAIGPTWSSADEGILVLAKEVGGAVWLFVVNENASPLPYTISGLDRLNGTVYSEAIDNRQTQVKAGKLAFSISERGVQVLRPKSE